MYRELDYRAALLLVAAVHLVISRRHLSEAGAEGTLKGPRAEGPWLASGTLISFGAFCLCAVLRLVNPDWLPWLELHQFESLRWSGVPIMAAGAALHLWGSSHLGPNLTVTISTRPDHSLVTAGPYRWIRHPLYAGGMVESTGACMLLGSGLVAAGASAFWLLVILRTPREEALLRERFGSAYVRYEARTGRFLPRSFRPWRGTDDTCAQ